MELLMAQTPDIALKLASTSARAAAEGAPPPPPPPAASAPRASATANRASTCHWRQ
jgi:hypothetical protein